MDSFEDKNRSSEIWGDSPPHPQNLTISMDIHKKEINIKSNDLDDKGRSI